MTASTGGYAVLDLITKHPVIRINYSIIEISLRAFGFLLISYLLIGTSSYSTDVQFFKIYSVKKKIYFEVSIYFDHENALTHGHVP